jgi:SSS family solute:Na+ symporter
MSLSPLIFTAGNLQKYASPFHSYLSIVFGTSMIFVVGFMIGAVLSRKKKAE